MSELKQITPAQLNSALTERDSSSRKSLSNEDSSTLLAKAEALARRYPSQDQESSIKEFFLDYEQLALKYSLNEVCRALDELRIAPGQKFFPRPDEVADMIVDRRERGAERARTGGNWNREWETHLEQLSSPEEVAWRIERFGYDPMAGRSLRRVSGG
jgi:hypothetical protein